MLYAAQAALCLDSALGADALPIHVAVAQHRDGRSTVRLSSGQVFDRPCQTAGKIAQVLQQHGIAVAGRPCGPRCEFDRLDRGA
ncbi:hypothetical protein A5742_03340 [Mycolicibacterium fortuitum]|uniref:Uncharacterized protein n=1 Tax=Mycolicibacterium fortuitum TaxID=1766 RepID=A0ABD6QKK3_MYCFO|nr:hypothetical protein A5734_15555 [Mycolicibacterium fortuitum]OMC43638.1 hypothetical protein A5742_03340 [Mycolicibacterium fortuitum]